MLPGILGEIAAEAGEEAALLIAKYRGGTQVYFPPDPPLDHWLCRLIGRDAAKRVCARLCDGHAGVRIDLPLGPVGRAARARAQVDAMLTEGRSERDIALATGYTTRAIRRRRAQLDRCEGRAADDRQMSLL